MGIRIVDLSQPLGRNTPLWPHVGVMNDVEIKRVAFPGRDKGRLTTVLTLRMHSATHMDAEVHVTPGGWTIDKLPLTSCYGPGVVLDMRYKKKWEELNYLIELGITNSGSVPHHFLIPMLFFQKWQKSVAVEITNNYSRP